MAVQFLAVWVGSAEARAKSGSWGGLGVLAKRGSAAGAGGAGSLVFVWGDVGAGGAGGVFSTGGSEWSDSLSMICANVVPVRSVRIFSTASLGDSLSGGISMVADLVGFWFS